MASRANFGYQGYSYFPRGGQTVSALAFNRGAFEAPGSMGFNLGGIIGKIGGGLLGIVKGQLGLPTNTGGGGPKQVAIVPSPGGALAIPGAGGALAAAIQVVQTVATAAGLTPTQALMVLEPQAFIAQFIAKQLVGSPAQGSSLLQKVKSALGAHGGGGKKHRRINPLNLRALTRADRRLTRFEHIARRYVRRSAPQHKVRAFHRRKRR